MLNTTYLIGNAQTRAYAILREQVYEALEKYNITPSHWSMIGIIYEARDGIRQSEIADKLNVKPPLITIMAKYLIEQGLIESAVNQFDTRSKLIRTTAKGKQLVKVVESDLKENLQKLMLGIPENDLEAYVRVLEAIISNKKKLQK